MKRIRATVLVTFALALLSHINLVAQEKARSTEPDQRAVAQSEAQQQQASSNADAEKKRAESKARAKQAASVAKAEAKRKQVAERAETQKRRAEAQEKRAEAQEKRAEAQEKRAEARAKEQEKKLAAHARRAIDEALRRALPSEGTFKFLKAQPNFTNASLVKDAPYSAIAITEQLQTLGDGNQIIQKNEATYYRDREGRMRIDQTLKTIGKWTAVGDPPRVVTIWDPVTARYYSLDPVSRTAQINPGRPLKPFVGPVKSKPSAPSTPSTASTPGLSSTPQKPKSDPAVSDSGRKRKESLGTKVIEGISAEGSRITRTIPAGEIGNVRPIEIVDESWYSPDLQMVVLTMHQDPRSGNTTYRLINIKRNNPERSLFEIPPGYRVVDRTAPKLPPRPTGPPGMAPSPKAPTKTEVIL